MPDNDFRFKAAVAALVILGGLVFYRMHHPSATFAADGIDADWDAAVQHSRERAQPTVILFTANWCSACRSLHGNVLSRGDVHEELERHYSFVTVDMTNATPQVAAHARKLGVRYIPLMIRFDANGNEMDRTNYLEPAQMIAWLKAGE
jgi:thiol:disulfide interchange protein